MDNKSQNNLQPIKVKKENPTSLAYKTSDKTKYTCSKSKYRQPTQHRDRLPGDVSSSDTQN